MSGRCAARGFTLIELLIGLTLTAVVLSILGGGLRLAVASNDRAAALATRERELQQVGNWLRRQLTQARAIELPAPADGPRPVLFAGERDAVEIVSPLPAHFGSGGLWRLRLLVGERGGRHALRLERRLLHPDDPPAPAEAERVLFEDLAAARFAYFGAPGQQQPPRWEASWNGRPGLPELVSLELEFRDGRRARLLAAPMTDGSGRTTSSLLRDGAR